MNDSGWLGFENLVKSVCETSDASVEHDVTMIGKSGAPRQIDVVIKSKSGFIEHLVLVEAKHLKRNVERIHVDALATSVRELSASKGVIFSTVGFQKGAISQAKAEGIDLFRIRPVEPGEFVSDKTSLDYYLHTIWPSVRNLSFPEIHSWDRDLSNERLRIQLGSKSDTFTPIEGDMGDQWGSLENLVFRFIENSVETLAQEFRGPINDGKGGVRRVWRRVTHQLYEKAELELLGAKVIVPKIRYDLGVIIWQQHLIFDRDDLEFRLALDNCVKKASFVVYRGFSEKYSEFQESSHLESSEYIDQSLNQFSNMNLGAEFMDFDFDGLDRGVPCDSPSIPKLKPVYLTSV